VLPAADEVAWYTLYVIGEEALYIASWFKDEVMSVLVVSDQFKPKDVSSIGIPSGIREAVGGYIILAFSIGYVASKLPDTLYMFILSTTPEVG
jgi:hypothetical protein